MKPKPHDREMLVKGKRYFVSWNFYPGFGGTRESPPEPPEVDVMAVREELNGPDIQDKLPDETMDEIVQQLWEEDYPYE